MIWFSRTPFPGLLELANLTPAEQAELTALLLPDTHPFMRAGAPGGPAQNTTWGGVQSHGVSYTRSGVWNWGASGVCQGDPGQSLTQTYYGCDIHASNTVVSGNLTVSHFFRGFNVRNVQNVKLVGVTSKEAGVIGSGHGAGGQGYYADHVVNFQMENVHCIYPAGHGLYIADTAQTVRLSGLQFVGKGEHSQLLQINSQDGTGVYDFVMDGCDIHVEDQSTGCANFLGVGRANQPGLAQHSSFRGGRPQNVAVDRTPGGANRASFMTFAACHLDGSLFIGAGCTVWLTQGTTIGGKTGPGKLIRVS